MIGDSFRLNTFNMITERYWCGTGDKTKENQGALAPIFSRFMNFTEYAFFLKPGNTM